METKKLPKQCYAVAVIMGEVDSPRNAVVHAVCPHCCSGPDRGMTAVMAAAKRIWSDVRPVRVTHPAGGAA